MRRVHLVGTLGQQDVPTGMTLVAQRVGQYLETISDGEPGNRLNAVHLPLGDGQTPVKADPGYMASFYRLELPEHMHLCVGLAHLGQDLETQKVALAEAERAARRPLGVSTPCGLGRRPAQAVELLDWMAALAGS